jgi:hypothetical protein
MDLAERLAGTIDVLAPLPVHPRDAVSESVSAATAAVAPEELEPCGAFWLVCSTTIVLCMSPPKTLEGMINAINGE